MSDDSSGAPKLCDRDRAVLLELARELRETRAVIDRRLGLLVQLVERASGARRGKQAA